MKKVFFLLTIVALTTASVQAAPFQDGKKTTKDCCKKNSKGERPDCCKGKKACCKKHS